MPLPIALQLYTVRELGAKDYAGTVKKVADIGYTGVEPAGYGGLTPAAAAKLYADLGLQVCSAHLPLPVGERHQEVLDTAKTLGITRVVSGFGPDKFATPELVASTCDIFNEAAANATAAGLQFCIHNHWWEFEELAGKRVYQHMLARLTPLVCFQVDTYWVKTGGADPAAVIRELGKRAPLLHIKDGPAVKGQPMTAVGDGTVDWAGVFAAAKGRSEWAIVELDACATDMMEAVAKSYRFLVGKGYASGRK